MTEYYDRTLRKVCIDNVYAEDFILWSYENTLGKKVMNHIFSKKLPNKLYGLYKKSSLSKKQIQKDIDAYQIDLNEFEDIEYSNYSDFFLRKFKPGIRPFESDSSLLPAFCEGRYLGHAKTSDETRFPVKGAYLSRAQLLARPSNEFEQGPILISRLCPIDYHHYHYPISGKIVEQYRIPGEYHSVNVHAVRNKPDIFLKNERLVTLIDSDHFGKLAMIEVGALCVGEIYLAEMNKKICQRGEYKGHFGFGASTVILIGEKDRWKPSQDIIENSRMNRETLVRLGEPVGIIPS